MLSTDNEECHLGLLEVVLSAVIVVGFVQMQSLKCRSKRVCCRVAMCCSSRSVRAVQIQQIFRLWHEVQADICFED